MKTFPIISKTTGLVVVFFFAAIKLSAQYDYSIKNFNANNGLQQNEIRAMSMDYNGFLWIGTRNGLIRYDGSNFKTFLFYKGNSYENTMLYMMNIPADKKLMVKTRGKFILSIEKGLPLQYSDSGLFSGGTTAITGNFSSDQQYKKFHSAIFPVFFEHNINADHLDILPVNEKDFITSSRQQQRLFYFKNGIRQPDIQLPEKLRQFFSCGQYHFLIDENNLPCLWNDTIKQFIKTAFNRPADKINKLNKNARFFYDAYSGQTFCFSDSTFYLLSFNPLLNLINFIPQFSIADKPHIWSGIVYNKTTSTFFLATTNEGFFQVKLKKIKTSDLIEKIPSRAGHTNVICYTALKTSDSTVVTPDGFQFTSTASGLHFSQAGNLNGGRLTLGLLPDKTVLVPNNGLSYFTPLDGYRTARPYNSRFKNDNSEMASIFPEGDSVWVSNGGALYNITKEKIDTVCHKDKSNGNLFGDFRFFLRINSKEAFITNEYGMYKLYTAYPYKVEKVAEMMDKFPRHICPYKDVMILSVYMDGLFILKNNQFYKVPLPQDRQELKTCHSTYIDSAGYAWIPTNKGLFKTLASSLVEAALHNGPEPFFYYYGIDDGIANVEFNGAGTPSYAVLPNGQLFYPSMAGIVTFKPKDLQDEVTRSAVFIEKITVDNNLEALPTDSIDLASGVKLLYVDVVAPDFNDPKNLILDYNLDDTGWKRIIVADKLRVTLIDIASGNHKLIIRKRTGFGNNDYTYTTLFINKAKALYEKPWFYILLLVAAALFVWLLLHLKTMNIQRQRALLQKKVDEQTAELRQSAVELSKEVAVKDLLISIISHDMVAPLRHVGLVAKFLKIGGEKDPEKVTEALSDIQSTSERILAGSNSIINWMKYNNKKIETNEQQINVRHLVNETMQLYVPLAKSKDIIIVNEVPESKSINADYNIISTILTNIISNAVKYTNNGRVSIFTEDATDGATTILKIADTGRGMNEQKLHIIREVLKGNLSVLKLTDSTSGLGYVMISELQKLHNLSLQIESEVDKGTVVSIIINAGDF